VVQLSLIYQFEPILYGNACCLSDFCDKHFSIEFPEYQIIDFIF